MYFFKLFRIFIELNCYLKNFAQNYDLKIHFELKKFTINNRVFKKQSRQIVSVFFFIIRIFPL